MRRLYLLPVILFCVVGLAACGSDDNTASSSATTAKKTTTTEAKAAGGTAVVKLTKDPKYGQILTDTSGNTLYLFMKDTGTTSVCTDSCAQLWPPVTATGTPTGDGVGADDLGTTARADGTKQVTFYGHPVYRYAPDTKPGDVTGEGVGNVWFVMDKDGAAVKQAPAAAATTTTTAKSGY